MSNHAINCVWELSDLSITQTLILVALANKANKKNICWPSVATLSSETNISRATIWENLKNLESRKLISRSLDYERNSNTYFLDFADNHDQEMVENQGMPVHKMVNNEQKLSTTIALSDTPGAGQGCPGAGHPYPGAGHPPIREPDTPYPGAGHKPTENHQFESSKKQEEKSLPVDNFSFAKKSQLEIGDILSKEQEKEILDSLIKLKNNSGGFYDVPTLEQVCYVILDKKSFKAAGNDFAWKLNSIKKCISNGNFKAPAELKAKKREETEMQKNQQQRKINEASQALRDAVSSRDNYQSLINKTGHLGEKHISKLADAMEKVANTIPVLKRALDELLYDSKGVAYD